MMFIETKRISVLHIVPLTVELKKHFCSGLAAHGDPGTESCNVAENIFYHMIAQQPPFAFKT